MLLAVTMQEKEHILRVYNLHANIKTQVFLICTA